MTIKDIEHVIARLPEKKLATFRVWFHKFDARIWDKQFKEDVKSGKFDKLAGKAIEDFKKDHCSEI